MPFVNPFSKSDQNQYFIVGLGNPGQEYLDTRHNVGFMVVDRVAQRMELEFNKLQSKALVAKGKFNELNVLLVKPRTFMNNSGQAVGALVRYYKVSPGNILIVYDDVDLSPGFLRIRMEGGSGGHKGMKSIIQHLSTQEFPRLRVGIGRPPGRMETPDYVLQRFSKKEEEDLPFLLDRASDAVFAFMQNGIEDAMTRFNQVEK
ncbi:MAG: aminoacyl-tRNA hydrolase [Anaerolineales bacterium]|nr:aminoacyl-tRNA hydrolase [Anaerolineales bacterium]